MNIPISWLKDYVNINCDTKTLADKMTMSGSKVETIESLGQDISGVVVGRIIKILPHPNADKLVITHIDIGESEHKQIVTGATNLKEGDYIPVALHGANLANDLKIKKGKIRGEVSEGMLCSIEELGYTRSDYPEAPEDGIYVFTEPQELGADARQILGLLDEVLEFEITSNRPDCFSVIGIAKEAAAVFNEELRVKSEELKESGDGDISGLIDVEIRDSDLCPRYIARVVKNVKIGPSPQWLRRRIIAAGLRPVNNIVDITNYVMLEYGQPMHAFDIRAIEGRIVVRTASNGEHITTLDGEEHVLDDNMLVIADTKKAVGIAGIMGGEFSKIQDDTVTILFESANFNGPNIRRTAKKLGLRTDSSTKYEKGLDPELSLISVNRACALVEELACGDVMPNMIDRYPNPPKKHNLDFDPAKINALLGTDISLAEMAAMLKRLGIAVNGENAVIPTYRPDIQIWEDLAEEIARLYGYDNIPTVIASSSNVGRKNPKQLMEEKLMETMTSLGYSETLSYAFESPGTFDKLLLSTDSFMRNAVRINNPLGEETGIMRTNPLNSMLTAFSLNYNRRNEKLRLFEIQKVYLPHELPLARLPKEVECLVFGGYGMDFFELKGAVEAVAKALNIKDNAFSPVSRLPFMHPGRTAVMTIDNEQKAYFGEIHPQVLDNYEIGTRCYIAVIELNTFYDNPQNASEYIPLPRFPEITRDIAVVVKNTVLNGDISAKIRENAGKYFEDLRLFDVYQGENVPAGTKSMGYRLTFRDKVGTLKDEDASKAVNKILAALKESFDAELRS